MQLPGGSAYAAVRRRARRVAGKPAFGVAVIAPLILLFDTWAPIVRALDDVGHAMTPAQQKAVCAFFGQLVAVMTEVDPAPAE